MTLSPGQEDLSPDWDDMRADVTIMLNRDQAAEMLVKLAEYVRDATPGDDLMEIRLTGRAYMAGRLPREATYTAAGEEAPNIIVLDEIHMWDFEADDFADSD
jgi:hypothetical protein